MRKNFTLIFVSSLLLMTVSGLNAQDAQNPWHLVVNENDEEVAFYNTEMINGIETTEQTVTIVLDNGKTFSHPVETTTFGFDPRRVGTGVANETFAVSAWNVFYANGQLHFTEMVYDIRVFTLYGALVAQFSGNYTDVMINLAQGFYIVQSNGKNVKLFVNKSGNGGTNFQPIIKLQTVVNTSNTVNLRASNIKVYWNITTGNTTMSVEMPNVEKFYFTADNSIVFTLKNGNSIELADYMGVEFAIEPTQPPGSGWELERTLQYGGCTYAMRAVGVQRTVVFAAVHKDGIAFQSKFIDETDLRYQWFSNANINSAMWNAAKANLGSRLSVFVGPVWEYGTTYPITYNAYSYIALLRMTEGDQIRSVVESWGFNGNTNLIPTTVVQNADGSITMSCKDINGFVQSHTFVNP